MSLLSLKDLQLMNNLTPEEREFHKDFVLLQRLHTSARYRAKERHLPFNIKPSDIVVPEVCPLLGIKLRPGDAGRGNHHAGSPTLDRIIPDLGYVKGNIQVISFRANMLKSNASLEELELLVKNWRAQKQAKVA